MGNVEEARRSETWLLGSSAAAAVAGALAVRFHLNDDIYLRPWEKLHNDDLRESLPDHHGQLC